MKFFKKWAGIIFTLAIFALSLHSLSRQLEQIHLEDILAEFSRVGYTGVFYSLLAVIGSFIALTFVDYIAFFHLTKELGYKKIALASIAGYGVSYNLGFSAITGSAVRYRLLNKDGLDGNNLTIALARLFIFFWLSAGIVFGVALLLGSSGIEKSGLITSTISKSVGLTSILLVLMSLAFFYFKKRKMVIAGIRIRAPRVPESLIAICFGFLDWSCAAFALYILLPELSISYPHFLCLFVIAQISGLISHVPGGLGVFETVILSELGGSKHHIAAMMSALIVFRFLYYILPLCTAGLILIVSEGKKISSSAQAISKIPTKAISTIMPNVIAFLVFLCGCLLLFSGASSTGTHRISLVKEFVPLILIEASHFYGSIAGIILIGLARGLWLRLREAYSLTIVILTIGSLATLLRGLHVEQSMILNIVILLLYVSRHRFYREGPILKKSYSPLTITIASGVLIFSTFILTFTYKHTSYAHQLWWLFALDGHASRSLRAISAAIGGLIAFITFSIFSTARVVVKTPSKEEINSYLPSIQSSDNSNAWLAILGDKSIIASESKDSFIMYGAEGISLIAMGDPIGKKEEFSELLWKFRELADEQGAYPVFYEVGPEYLTEYIDLGLAILKLGEVALVQVQKYSLDGGKKSSQRQAYKKLEKEGYTFDIIQVPEMPNKIDELHLISNQWLNTKNSKEKGFSLGRFIPDYILQTPCAVIMHSGEIVAFSNLWLTESKKEYSIDLMRYGDKAPKGVMEFLFLKLFLWGKEQGYENFNLGMAPLSGFESHTLAPIWHKAGIALFRHGENFYNFQGLRNYKNKFDPIWTPRYLASPGGLALPRILTNVTTLISGGIRGVFGK